MSEAVTKDYLNEQIDLVVRTVKGGFDHVDERFERVESRLDKIEGRLEGVEGRLSGVEGRLGQVEVRLNSVEEDLSSIKERLRVVENDTRSLATNMVTKQYLDAKFNQLMIREHKDSLFKRSLILALEQARILSPEARAKFEALIPQ